MAIENMWGKKELLVMKIIYVSFVYVIYSFFLWHILEHKMCMD